MEQREREIGGKRLKEWVTFPFSFDFCNLYIIYTTYTHICTHANTHQHNPRPNKALDSPAMARPPWELKLELDF